MPQPFLHDLTISLHAPVQSWAAADGGVDGTSPGTVVQGLFCGDERVVSQVLLQVTFIIIGDLVDLRYRKVF